VDDAVEDGVGIGWIADQVVPFVDRDLAEYEVNRSMSSSLLRTRI